MEKENKKLYRRIICDAFIEVKGKPSASERAKIWYKMRKRIERIFGPGVIIRISGEVYDSELHEVIGVDVVKG